MSFCCCSTQFLETMRWMSYRLSVSSFSKASTTPLCASRCWLQRFPVRRHVSTFVDRPMLTLTSHFMLPEQGMTEYEPLSRSSAFVVQSELEIAYEGQEQFANDGSPGFGASQKLHFLTSQHVTHPFHFPNYYPPEHYEWVQFIREANMKYTVEVRSEDGQIVFQYPLSEDPELIFCHPKQ